MKHVGINEAFIELSISVELLADLFYRIRDGNPPPTEAETNKADIPPLGTTLEQAEGKLRDSASRVREYVEQIQELLF